MLNCKEQTKEYLNHIEAYLDKECFLHNEPQKELFEAMRYSLLETLMYMVERV